MSDKQQDVTARVPADLRVGVDYYPEHWPEERVFEDIRLMREAGIALVRMAEFAWSRMEPSEGDYRFEWLERVLDALHEAGIRAILGTPTAAPPAWLHQKYPDLYPLDEWRRPLGFGTRLQRCLNNPVMRDYSRRITTAMARRFGAHSAVEGWQTDNEFTQNHCFCDHCAAGFREWLRHKYGDLETLNSTWGTVFWSQEYTAWEQIPLPWFVKCGLAHNPSLKLDFRRFQSDSTVSFQQEQVEILRGLCPGQLITHNMMGLYDGLNCFDLTEPLDVVTWDNYPVTPWGNGGMRVPLGHDVMRGLKQRNFWVMEEQSGITGWENMSTRPAPGQVRAWSWQAVAHGADTVVYFRWRSCRHGAEQYWHGVLGHDGVPRRRYREVADVAADFARVSGHLSGSEVLADVAILNGYDQHYAYQIQPQAQGLEFWEQALRFYTPLWERGVNIDIVCPSRDLSRYKLVIAPGWYVLTPEVAERLRRYVRGGGALILNPRTGVKDANNVCVEEPLPGLLRDVAGVTVDDYNPLGANEETVVSEDGAVFRVTTWADALAPETAETCLRYQDSIYAGEPAVTVNEFGQGKAWYFGAFGEPALYKNLLPRILRETGTPFHEDIPDGVELRTRVKDGKRILLAVNLTGEEKTIAVPTGFSEVLGITCAEESRLAGYGVSVFVEQ